MRNPLTSINAPHRFSRQPVSMSEVTKSIDVRRIPPRIRHDSIFRLWNELQPGDTLLLINDHDPVPLYYQFAADYPGEFHWEYSESGPVLWQIRIRKGSFEHPGFVPTRQVVEPCPAPITFADLSSFLKRGQS